MSYRNRRHPKHTGVYQRCLTTCPERCRDHTWAWSLEVAVRDEKRQRYGQAGYATAKEAADARAAALVQHRAGALPTVAVGRMTLADWLPGWLDRQASSGEIRANTAGTYEQLARTHLLPALGHARLVDIRGTHLSDLYERLRGRLSPATIRRLHAVASGCLRDAWKDGLIPANPAPAARLPKVPKRKPPVWTPDQAGAFLDAIVGERLYPLYALAIGTGMRRGEMLQLRWSDVDLETGCLQIRAGKTDAAVRTVWLDGQTVEVLRRWRRQQVAERLAAGPVWGDGEWVFTNELGNRPRPETVTKAIHRLARVAGLPEVKLHSLRHLRVHVLIATGEDIAVIAKMMGHATSRVTEAVYGDLLPAKGQDVTRRAAAAIPRRSAG